VREESHLDDMRAAIRGDFERLEQRLGTQELMHVREPEPALSQVLAAEPVELAQVTQVTQVEPVESEEVVDPFGPDEPVAPAPRSWLARLLAAIPPRQV
jgi:hypothetical protein